jgi:hypothetical protein
MCRESTLTVGHLSVTLASWLARVKTRQWDEPLSSHGDGQARSADCAEHYERHHTAAIHEPHWTIHIPKAWVEARRPAQLRVCPVTPRAPRADHGNGRPLINPDVAALADLRAVTSSPSHSSTMNAVPVCAQPAAAGSGGSARASVLPSGVVGLLGVLGITFGLGQGDATNLAREITKRARR